MFARIITFKIKPGTAEEVQKRAEKSAVPWLMTKKGFHGMHMIKVSDTEMLAFEMWESKTAADASRKEVENHIQQIVGDLLAAAPSFVEGEQVVHAAGPDVHHVSGMHTPR